MNRPIVALACWLWAASVVAAQPVATPQESPAGKPAQSSKARAEAKSDKKDTPSIYMRLVRDRHDEPTAMQTSIVRFRPAAKAGQRQVRGDVTVDLIGAVHVADRGYFKRLERLFRDYDALLYELVAPANNNVPSGGRSQHPVGQMQLSMKRMLELSYQLEEIDYRARNFVHADMSPTEFANVMSERNESFLQMMMKMMGAAMAMQAKPGRSSDAELLMALFSSDRALRLKRVMSTQMSDLEGMMSILEGDNGSTIIGQRNRKALEVLRREINAGKRKIAIFYGAGHMPDMEKRLKNDFGMVPDRKSVRWLTAWDMSGK